MADPTPNERRITTHAQANGWTIHSRDDLMNTVEYRKRGRKAFTVAFGLNGHARWTSGAPRPIRTTSAVLAHLESR
ncbi:hypothetical protein [Kitasatospora mediocidica]|uniref:hypothetical protein n=1 Tax=Kitasatospora mediocidica TaxID=58352 RepID=UPI00056C9664|nr:hypothetical protein [Kitasatospora mediocidica]